MNRNTLKLAVIPPLRGVMGGVFPFLKEVRWIFLVFIVLLTSCTQSSLTINRLTVEFLEQPIGISSESPSFGWVLTSGKNGALQTAYQVIVKGAQGEEVWNTNKVNSNQSQLVKYNGVDLVKGRRYHFEVRVWDEDDRVSELVSSWFEMAPASENLTAQWIGAITREDANLPEGRNWHAPSLKKNRELYDNIPELARRSIQLRKEMAISKEVTSAKAYISGLGHYELSLNGSKVSNSVFAPLWADYDKSIFYNTYDITSELEEGNNAIGVWLGNGMYNVIGDRYRKFWVSFGPPTLFFQLELQYDDGTTETIKSDQSWKYAESPITFNCMFGGEDYDARMEQLGWDKPGFDDSNWKPVVIQNPATGELKSQLAPDVQMQEQFGIKEWEQVDSAVYVFDMSQNLSGYPSLKVKGKAGQKVKLVVGERLDEDGKVTQRNTGGPHYYEYTLKGDAEEEWTPRFSYYGYQYIQVEGAQYQSNSADLPQLIDLKSNFIYSNAEEIGFFECSNEIFTKTHVLINNAVKSNMQAVFTDCPHREKLGWIEEIHLVGPGLLFNYDLTQLFRKAMMDMADAQRPSGLIPNIAPEYVDFSQESWGADFTDSPEWGAAVVMVPWLYYEYYGDSSLIVQYYDVMAGYVDYLGSRAENHIVSHGLGDWYDYGEHRAGYGKNSPISLSATAHYFLCVRKLGDAAALLSKPGDIEKYESLSDQIRGAFNAKFFDQETKEYATGSQYSNAIAIYLDLVSLSDKEAVLQNLVTDIKEHRNRLTTGDVGNRYLFQALAENGLNELMFQMHDHYEAPGYGYQLQYGLTTLTEQWDPAQGNSWNHFMMGQIEEWFFKSILGIQPDTNQPGFKHFIIAPKLVGDLTYAKGGFESIYGTISVDWKIQEDIFEIEIEVPVNTEAAFHLPEKVDAQNKLMVLTSGVHKLNFPLKK